MIRISNPTECCGCTACASICTHNAIEMIPDVMGFMYPKVDEDKCVECGLCEKICAFNDNYDKSDNLTRPIAYGVRHKDVKEVETSRSGAAFVALSDWVLNNQGVIYGVGFDEHFRVAHKRASCRYERDEFKGSKYAQSFLGNIFRQVKEDLKGDRLVLFSGTPCQVAGLKSYVGKKYRDKLYLIDIVCHGVAAPFIWRDYLKLLEEKEGKKITSVNFRDKKVFGWAAHKETFMFGDTYTYTYYNNIINRKSCNVCHFCNLKRPGDITIADFWGWQNVNETINVDNKGISLVFINSDKGRDWFIQIQKDLIAFPVPLEFCMQPNLQHASAENPNRDKFEKDYSEQGLKFAIDKYIKNERKYKLRSIKYVILNLFHRNIKFLRI